MLFVIWLLFKGYVCKMVLLVILIVNFCMGIYKFWFWFGLFIMYKILFFERRYNKIKILNWIVEFIEFILYRWYIIYEYFDCKLLYKWFF